MRSQFVLRNPVGSSRTRLALRLSTVGLLALGLGACSSDAVRFSDTPFANPFQSAQAGAARDPATTGSIGRAADAPLPRGASASPIASQKLPPPQSAVALRSAAPVPVAGAATGWTAQGGTPIVVAQGETLDMLSSRYGVPRAALISANGLSSPSLAPGSRLVIPVYNAAAAGAPRQVAQDTRVQSDVLPAPRLVQNPAPAVAPSRPAAVSAAAASPVDARGRAQAAREAKAASAADARAKSAADAQTMRETRAKYAAEAKARAEARKSAAAGVRPAAPAVAAAKPAAEPRSVAAPKPVVAVAPAESRVAAAPKVAAVADPKTTASVPKEPAAEAPATTDFRWPARGRVIAGYSGKGGNEGINIAVPEGTPVKAAEGGTVAYAGNELKGYGNLVLIRHPNGYVSAYAHNGDLKVKRGDAVKRGQVVASSGQSGNVSSPQLHFELRKGSAPVDPTPYLSN